MKNKLQRKNTFSLESLKKLYYSSKNNNIKRTLTLNKENNDISNKTVTNNNNINSSNYVQEPSNIFQSQKPANLKIINNQIKQNENIKSDLNEEENSDAKLIKSHTKVSERKSTLNKNILDKINQKKMPQRKNTFQLNYKFLQNALSKSSYKVFTTSLNQSDNKNRNKKSILYENYSDFTQRNALIIPEEDKIFDEFKKYKYFTDRYNKRFNININNNNDDKNNNIKKTNFMKLTKRKINNEKKNFTKTFYDSKGNFIPSRLDKDIFECLYKTNDDFYTQLNLYKKSKKNKKLKDYQKGLLESVKDIVSVYGYYQLQKKFDEIHKRNKYKMILNYPIIQELENKEKVIINNINKCNKNYLKNKKSRGYIRYKFDLPVLKFKRIFHESVDDKKLKDFMKSRNIDNKELLYSPKTNKDEGLEKNEINKLKLDLSE